MEGFYDLHVNLIKKKFSFRLTPPQATCGCIEAEAEPHLLRCFWHAWWSVNANRWPRILRLKKIDPNHLKGSELNWETRMPDSETIGKVRNLRRRIRKNLKHSTNFWKNTVKIGFSAPKKVWGVKNPHWILLDTRFLSLKMPPGHLLDSPPLLRTPWSEHLNKSSHSIFSRRLVHIYFGLRKPLNWKSSWSTQNCHKTHALQPEKWNKSQDHVLLNSKA